MKKIYFLLFLLLATTFSFGQIVINEVDADTPGTDVAEFIELKGTANASLDGFVVVLYNGSNDLSYGAYDLDGKTFDANGFFILGNASLISGSDILIADNFIQNGADAVAVYQANGTDFPNGTAVTSVNLIDALVYDTSDADDTGLLTGLGETVQYDENLNTDSSNQSLQLDAAGTAYETKATTFRQENNATVCGLSITTTSVVCDAITSGMDTYTATFAFTGGGTATYQITVSSGTVSGDSPSSLETGSIVVSGINEGTNLTMDVVGGICNLNRNITSPLCNPDASLPYYEPFNYVVTSALGGQNGWVNLNSGDDVVVATGNLSYTGLLASTGNMVTFDAAGIDPKKTFTPVTSGEVYASFIFKITAQSAITDLTDGGYFASLSDTDTTHDIRLWVKPNPDAESTTYSIGFGDQTQEPPFTTSTYNVGDNVFVVMLYNVTDGTISLWINPSSSSFGLTAPLATFAATDASKALSISKFIIRQDSTGETPFIQMDELRIGTTWASVTPADSAGLNESNIVGFSMYPNPTHNSINIFTTANLTKNVQIFDLVGKQVLNEMVTGNSLNLNLKSGIYVVKVEEAGKVATQKLVIE